MMDKIKSLWGSSTLERDEYEKAMANMRAQEVRRQMDAVMMNSAQGMQNAAQQSALHNPYIIKDSKYSPLGRYVPPPLEIREGNRNVNVGALLLQLEYILQRTVPDYDELVKQYNAIKDIERSNNDIR
jgi:hypothetical protein